MTLLLQLFATFFVIGLFTFGGGAAMLPLLQDQVVTRFGWITEGQFADIVAISQCTPGPVGINCATYVGYSVAGVAGSAVATFALVLPSLLIFYAIVTLYNKYHTTGLFNSVMAGLRPATAGLIAAAGVMLMFRIDPVAHSFGVQEEIFPDAVSWILLAAGSAASLFFRVNPIILLLAGGIIGLILY